MFTHVSANARQMFDRVSIYIREIGMELSYVPTLFEDATICPIIAFWFLKQESWFVNGCRSLIVILSSRYAFPWHHAWRKKSLNCFYLFGVSVIAALANAARWIFELWKINCKICSSNFCTISTTKDTTIMTHVFKKWFVVFFTWWVLPRSHNNWYRIF